MPKLLVLFERSGAVSIPFREAGFDVTTVDLYPHLKDNTHHICCDVRELLKSDFNFSQFDLLIAFPPCTYFSKAGLHWLHKQFDRRQKQLDDLEMIKQIWDLPIERKCLENPGGSALNKLWRKADCLIDYCQFADFKKPTCLWLQGLPPLLPTQINLKHYGSLITTLNGFNRSITPIEVGYAMVRQWFYLFIDDYDDNYFLDGFYNTFY